MLPRRRASDRRQMKPYAFIAVEQFGREKSKLICSEILLLQRFTTKVDWTILKTGNMAERLNSCCVDRTNTNGSFAQWTFVTHIPCNTLTHSLASWEPLERGNETENRISIVHWSVRISLSDRRIEVIIIIIILILMMSSRRIRRFVFIERMTSLMMIIIILVERANTRVDLNWCHITIHLCQC